MSEKTIPVKASTIKIGDHAMLKARPCKIIQRSVSKTGKHGHAKIHFVGVDVFTQRKYEDICPTTHTMQKPILSKKEYELIDIDANDMNMMCLLDTQGKTKENVRLPEDGLGDGIAMAFQAFADDDNKVVLVTVLTWGEEEAVIDFKTASV